MYSPRTVPGPLIPWWSCYKANPKGVMSRVQRKQWTVPLAKGDSIFVRVVARTGLICASMSPPCSTASPRASTASPSSCFGFTSWTKRNSSAAPVEGFFSQRKKEDPETLSTGDLSELFGLDLAEADLPPHCLQIAQVRTRVRRKHEGANSLSVPSGQSGPRHKPSANVFSLFSLVLLASSEQLAQEVLAGTTTDRWTRKQSAG